MSVSESRQSQVRTEQIRLLYGNARVGIGASICVAIALGYLQWGVIPHRIILGWLLYLLVIYAIRLVVLSRYLRAGFVVTKATAWHAAFIVGASLSAAAWGSGGILLYSEAHLENQVFLAFAVGGMMLGAASVLAPRIEAFLPFIILTGLPIVIRFLLHGDAVHRTMGLVSGVFTIATLLAAWQFHLAIDSSLSLRFENQDLVNHLQDAMHQLEDALRDSQSHLALAQSTARLGIWDQDLQTNTSVISAEYARLHGLSPDRRHLTHAEWLGAIHADDRQGVQELMRETVQQRRNLDTEFRVVWPDGTVHWLLTKGQVCFNDSGRPVRLAGVALDLTARKEAEVALRESEERFRNLADSAPVMIWVAGTDKVLNFFNKTWLEFVGRTVAQELNNGWVQSVHPDDLDECAASYSSAFDARQTFHIECRLRRADGEYRWVLCTGVPRFADGIFAGYIGSDVDITDLKRAQEEALARQKLESLGLLSAGIAHDFNNLLGGILATSEVILSELPAGSPAHGGVQTIKNVANRGAEIVREMMAYSGQGTPGFEPVDISRVVAEMMQFLSVSVDKGSQLKVDLEPNLPAVRANAAQVGQIVMNMVVNASEALEAKEGVISVTVVRAQRDSAGPTLPPGDYVRLEVADTGCGMTEEIQGKIFDPFFTTKAAGRGLGLAAVQGIVRGHGGIMNVDSVPGRGTRMEIFFPCMREPAEEARGAAGSAANGNILAATVLVIEDEEPLRRAVSKQLRRNGLTVIEAGDARSAVNLFRVNAPNIDVVLLDMTLPGMCGRQVLEELRQIRPGIKVIVTSAYSEEYVLNVMKALKPWLYIRKPYQFTDLMDLLRKTCSSTLAMGNQAAGSLDPPA